MRKPVIIKAPSVLGLRPSGVQELPAALLGAGLRDRLSAVDGGQVDPPAFDPRRDPDTGILNPDSIAHYSVRLADVVGEVLARGHFPIVLGGDCSILLGNLLALRRRGRYGLLFIDGHTDFYQPSAEPNGEVASMDLALAAGRGPAVVVDVENRRPLVRDEDVVAFGFRDAAESAQAGMQPLPASLRTIDLDRVREAGAAAAADQAVAWLSGDDSVGYWIHLDVDVLDDAVMPAVDYRLPGGLTWLELETVLRTAMAGGRAVGIDVTIFNPRLDLDGRIATRLVESLCCGLSVLTAQGCGRRAATPRRSSDADQ